MTTTVSVSAGEAPQSSTRVERVIWGKSYTDAVVNELHRLSTKRAFLVVSKSLNSDTDLVVRLEQALGQYFVGKKVGIRPHTPWEDIIELTKEIQSAKADVIITLGGGSITDAAKVALLAVANEVNTPDDLNTLVFDEQSVDTVLPPNIQLICIPTSLSGGEYNSGSGATDSRVGAKRIFRHPLCVPKSIILDPVITLHTPDWLWLSTGMRSVDHCVETLSSLNSNSESDDLAAIALKKLTGSLLQTKHNRQDISSRLQSLLGVWEATQASVMKEVDLGAPPAIAHALGGACNVPHGYTSCVMLPAVMSYNMRKNQGRQERVRRVLLETPEVIQALKKRRVSEDATAGEILSAVITELELPRSLKDVGVRENVFQEIAQKSLYDPWAKTNPIPLESTEQVEEILRLAA